MMLVLKAQLYLLLLAVLVISPGVTYVRFILKVCAI